jgi:branched-chain amino acid transport system substrate-binding protein
MVQKYPDVEFLRNRQIPFIKNYHRIIVFTLILISFSSCILSNSSHRRALKKGIEYYKTKDYNSAIREFEKIIEGNRDNPYSEKAYFYAAKSYAQIRDFKKAMFFFNSLIENYPLSDYITQAEYECCLIYFNTGHYKLTVKNLEIFIQKSPTDMMDDAYFLLGRCYQEEKLYHRAIFYFQEAIRRSTNTKESKPIHLYIARCCIDLNETKAATKELENIKGTDDKDLICEKLAIEYDMLIHKKDVIASIDKLIEIHKTCDQENQKPSSGKKIEDLVDKISDIKVLGDISDKYSSHFPGDYAIFRIIKLSREKGDIITAVLNAREFLSKYPESDYKPQIKTLLDELSPQNGISSNKIGCILPLSGNYELFGKNVLYGIKLALKVFKTIYPDVKIDLIVKDNKGLPEKTNQCLEELAVKEGVIAVIGPVLSINAKAILKSADALQIPVISPSASAPDIIGKSKFFMRNCITLPQQIKQILEFAHEKLKIDTFALIYPENKYGFMVRDIFDDIKIYIEKSHFHKISYTPESADFKTQIGNLSKIADRPIGILLPDSPNIASMIASQIAFYGIENYQLLGINNWNSQDIFKSGEQFVQGGIFCDNFNKDDSRKAVQYFKEQFKNEYSQEPDYMQAQAYDTTIMIMQRIKNGASSRILMNEQLHKIQNFHGVSGITSMNENGEAEKKLIFFKIQDGKFIHYDE